MSQTTPPADELRLTDEKILIFDFGSQYAQLIARRVRDLNVYCEIVRHDLPASRVKEIAPRGIILSGLPGGDDDACAKLCDPAIFSLGISILDVGCYPEFTDPEVGGTLLADFLMEACGCTGSWKLTDFARLEQERVRQQVGDGRVICALSGGVDSAVVAALLAGPLGDRLSCIHVDHGLLRKNESESVIREFTEHFKIDLHVINARERFLKNLAGVTEPQEKRKIIGHTFIDVFAEAAESIKDANFLAQGTLYPDIIESGGTPDSPAATIKLHHNVGGLPEDLSFALIEPLRDLFKDEVRRLGTQLGLPDEIVWRHPFPGPGLGVRCLGELTEEKLDVLREADAIVVEELREAGLYRATSQTFAVLLPVQSVGVSGDERTYENAIAIRSVDTEDFMTADWSRLPYDLLARMSTRIINEVKGINRVVYDISSKPPATIEWE